MQLELTKEEFQKKFGHQLMMLRMSKKLSLRGLASRCDVDHSDIGKIEKGQVNIKLSTINELAKGLELHPSELFSFDG